MRKVIDAMAVLGFVSGMTVVVGAGALWMNRDTILNDVKALAIEQVQEMAPSIVEGLMGDMMPEMPVPAVPAGPTPAGPTMSVPPLL